MPIYPYFFLSVTAVGWLAGLLKSPICALLTYLFIYFNIPASQWWGGYVPDLRWSYTSAAVLVVSIFLHRDKVTTNPFQKGLGTRLLIIYLGWMLITVPFAAFPETAFNRVYDFFRYVLVFCLVVAVVDNVDKLRAYLWVMLSQVAWISWSARSYFSGERLDGVGPGDAGDANGLAVLLLSVIPFLLVFLLKGRTWERLAALFTLPIVLNCFVMTRSRGGFLGLVVMLVLIFILERDKKIRRWLIVLSISALAGMFLLADQSFKDRLINLSKQDVSSDSAGGGRIGGWRHGLKMVSDYPLGSGGGGYMLLSPEYLPQHLLEQSVGMRAAHNTFLLILVEQGAIGLAVFLLFFLQVLRITLRGRRKFFATWHHESRDGPNTGSGGNGTLSYMLGGALLASLGGVAVSSFFVDRLYYEGLYFLCALGPVIYMVSVNGSLRADESTEKNGD